jgi:hypothetical protein
MSYNVYLVAYQGLPRNHHAIFFETENDKSGFIYQVSGNIREGMQHDHKKAKRPQDSVTFVSKTYLGITSHADYASVGKICNTIEPPKKQFIGGKRLYPNEPIRRCQEWTKEAIEALRTEGILEDAVETETGED